MKLELEQLPGKIEALEAEVEVVRMEVAAPEFYSRPAGDVTAALDRLAEVEARLEQTIERWMALEEQDS